MQQDERSERSRTLIMTAALRLFSSQGYRATSVREIAESAGVSTGNLYHHFADKEAILKALLNQYFTASMADDFPLNRAIRSGAFPENLERIGVAVRDIVIQWKDHIRLMYVDVIEFEGHNIARMYEQFGPSGYATRTDPSSALVHPDIDVQRAVRLAVRTFFHHFTLNSLFGIRDNPPRSDERVILEISRILRDGVAARETG